MAVVSTLPWPPGFGFHPTDVELISYYLKRKILGLKQEYEVIPELDIYKHEPWELPDKCLIPSRECKWHFFTPLDKKYPNGSRTNRATEEGYWKSTGKDRSIWWNKHIIGTKKTLVFHRGRPPSGERTNWIMHEYHLDEKECETDPGMQDIYVLCRVTKKDLQNGGCSTYLNPSLELDLTSKKRNSEVESHVMLPAKTICNQSDETSDYETWIAELYDPCFSTAPHAIEL